MVMKELILPIRIGVIPPSIEDIRKSIKRCERGYWQLGKFVLKEHLEHESFCPKRHWYNFWKDCDCEGETIIDSYIDNFEWMEGNPTLLVIHGGMIKELKDLIK